MFSQWVTVRCGIDESVTHLQLLAYNKCLPWHAVGYEMRPIANQQDAQRRPPGAQPSPDQHRGFRPPVRTGRDFSRIKCFSCGEFGHMQSRCQKPDATLPFRPAGWHLQSDNRPLRDGNNSQGNS